MSFKKEICPYCGNTECEADWVDVEVGFIQCGPYYCNECGSSEIGSFDDIGFDRSIYDKWNEENYKFVMNSSTGKYSYEFIGNGKDKFILPKEATISQEEWDKGWFKPGSPMGSSVNTYNGEYVDHVTAKSLYDKGLLDVKEDKF